MQHPSFLEAGWLHYFRRIVEHIHGLHVEYTFTCDVRYRAVPLTWPLLHPPWSSHHHEVLLSVGGAAAAARQLPDALS
jgi:hypothetical protein